MNSLLTLADIQAMHHCSLRHTRDVIVRMPGFPLPAPTSTARNQLWVSSEVMAFVTRQPPQAANDPQAQEKLAA